MKDIERCRTSLERIQLTYFIYPVNEQALSDYSVYVRNPIDLSTIKFKLDGTLPGVQTICELINKQIPKYSYFSEFLTDVRRVFTNSLKYNKEHLLTDSTGVTKLVLEAAESLGARVELLIPMFTVHLADRIERIRIAYEEIETKENVNRIRIQILHFLNNFFRPFKKRKL
jgi:hypothetical protein